MESGSLCLKARAPSATSLNPEDSSWLPVLSSKSTQDETDMRARFKSPSVSASFGLKCISFDYSINLGKRGIKSKVSTSHSTLTFLQQHKGYHTLNPACISENLDMSSKVFLRSHLIHQNRVSDNPEALMIYFQFIVDP